MKRYSRARDSDGFIVFGALIMIVGSIVAAVLIGKLVDHGRRPAPAEPLPRALRYAAEPAQVRFGALVTRRHSAGDAIWVWDGGAGEVVVFESAASNRIVGFLPAEALLDDAPAPSARAGRRSGGRLLPPDTPSR
jgi:hypothetical protein